MSQRWIQHVKEYAASNGIKYHQALKDPNCRTTYYENKRKVKGGNVFKKLQNSAKVVMKVAKQGNLKVQNSMMPPIITKMISNYGNRVVVGATLYKHKISGVITGALNLLGNHSNNYKELHHLRIYFNLDNGQEIFIEKNKRLNGGTGNEKPGSQKMRIEMSDLPQGLTFGEIVENTKNYMGPKFIPYSSSSNNCQYFIMGILQANRFGNVEKYREFIKEDTEEYFKNRDGLRKIANTFTDLGGTFNAIQNGGTLQSKKIVKKSKNKKTNVHLKEITDINKQIYDILHS